MDLKVKQDNVTANNDGSKLPRFDLTFVFIYLYGVGIMFCFCIFICRFKKHMKIAYFRVCKIDNYYACKLALLNLYRSMRT